MRTTALGFIVFWALAGCVATEDAPKGPQGTPKGPPFSCRGRTPGYYADLESNCQDYHMCDASGRRYTYSCPNQTRFQQRVMICDHWFLVDCSLSESHFDANLLIGQKDKHFVEQFLEEDGHGEEKFFYPNRLSTPSPRRNYTQPQVTKENKKNLLVSATKKETSVKYPETKFTTSNGAIKFTTERSLPREFVNNPFFSSLTQAPSSAAAKGEQDAFTFHQRTDQVVSSGPNLSQKQRPTPAPLPLTPPSRLTTPQLHSFPPIVSNEPRRPTTVPTTQRPSTFDYGFVTREGRPNHLTQKTEPPRLFRNDLSKVIEITSFGAYTTEPPPLTTDREPTKTRERIDVRAPIPLTRAPPTPAIVPPIWAPPIPTTKPNRTQTSSYEVGFSPFNGSQSSSGLLRTPGGFRYVTKDTVLPPERQPALGGTGFLSPVKYTSGPGSTETFSTGFDRTTERVKPTATGFGFSSGPSASTGTGSSTGISFPGKGFPSGTGTSTGGEFQPSFGSVSPSGPDYSTSDDIPTGPDSSLEGHFHGISFGEPGSSPGEDEEDLNTVEVRIPDPRRMFFIPDNAASEAEMLNSTNETVLRIPLPSSRHHGAMKFKGVRGAKGRNPDCPHCHPAFLVPGTCQPCVRIRR